MVIDPTTKRATAIELTTGQTIHANNDEILFAGTYQTPQILMLPGISPASELTKDSIPTIDENPGVGTNFHDQLDLYISYNLHDLAATTNNLALGSPTSSPTQPSSRAFSGTAS